MRVTLADVFRVRQGQVAEQFDGLGLQVGAAVQAMDQGALHHLVEESFRRVEGRRRALGNVGHAIAAQALQLLLAQGQHVMFADPHHPGRQAATAAGITQQGQGDGGLAGAGFADQRQHLALLQGEAHALDDLHFAALAAGDHPQVFHSNQLAHLNDLPDGGCGATRSCR